MVDLGLVANVATAAAVGTGVAFGVLQVRYATLKRREAAAYEFLHSIQSPEFIRATRTLVELPEGLTAEQVRNQGPRFMDDLYVVFTIFEDIGAMVHRRIIDITIVDDVYGGFLRMAWRKVRPYAEATRAAQQYPAYMEWIQWLAERLEELDRPEKKVGAYVAYKAWRP